MNKYYKVKSKAFESNKEIWIVVKAGDLHEAFHKAEDHCSATNHIFYPMEQTLHEITKEEYWKEMEATTNAVRPKNR